MNIPNRIRGILGAFGARRPSRRLSCLQPATCISHSPIIRNFVPASSHKSQSIDDS